MSITPAQLALMLTAPGSYGYLCAVDAGGDLPFFSHHPVGRVVHRVTPAEHQSMVDRAGLRFS